MRCESPTCDESDESKDGSENLSFEETDGSNSVPWKSPPSFAKMPYDMPADVVYKQLYQLRITQMKQGVDLSRLTRVQWGLTPLKFSHHIVLKKSPWKNTEIPFTFRVTVCKTCSLSQDASSMFLGVYGDQESALLVNDVHEILCGRCDKLSVLRKEDAMFFHHLTARTLDEREDTLLPSAPVLSVLEKLRIDSANAALLAAEAIEEKKRKRSSSMDLLIESSQSLSMTSRDNSSSNGEGDEGEDEDEDEMEGEEYDNDESCVYSSSSTYRNHSPFSSTCPSHSATKPDTAVTRSKSNKADATHSTDFCHQNISPAHSLQERERERERDSEKLRSLHLLALSESLPRTRKTNRPRASTFSVVSSAPTQSNSQSLLDNEAERTPMGLVTWLASLEDDDFVAAKLLTEMGLKEKNEDSPQQSSANSSSRCDIPQYRGARNRASSNLKDSATKARERDNSEPPTQRRRRANSVIEVTRAALDSEIAAQSVLDSSGKYPRTYRKDPNWASEGRSRGYVGAYSPAERRRRIERFLEKRRLRVWQKNVKYDVRKNFADSRIRVKGRFVKKEDQAAMILSMRLEACLKDSIGVEMDEDGGGENDDEMDKCSADMMYSDSSAYSIKIEHSTLPMITEMVEQSDEQDEDYQNKGDGDGDGDGDEDDIEGSCEVNESAAGSPEAMAVAVAGGRSSSSVRIEGPFGDS